MKKLLSTLAIIFLFSANTAWAIDIPEFPSCPNPGGTKIADYNDGLHGVPGNPTSFSGRDTVYKIDDTRTVQCLCLSDGTGIQTNYWKVSSLDQEQIETLRRLDWVFIPNGNAWGLDNSTYMAKNTAISCGATLSSSTSNGVGGQVLGLAATGDSVTLLGLASLGIAILMAGVILQKRLN